MTWSGELAVELYYVTRCSSNRDYVRDEPVPFPPVNIDPVPEGSTGKASILKIFRKDKNVRVAEQPTGTIRITIGKVPTKILETRISELELDKLAQYNPIQAIRALMNTKDMDVAMRSLKLKPVGSLASTMAEPDKDMPRLPSVLRNVTVEQILDRMAKLWDGPVLYGICANDTETNAERLFFIDTAQDVMPKGYWRKQGLFRPE